GGRGGGGGSGLAGRVDLLPLVGEEVLGALLESARLLDAEAGLDRELVLVLAEDVLDAAVARVLEELHRALADAADEEQLLLVRERLGLRRRRVDALLAERLHGLLGGLADLRGVLDADALDPAD